jgi:hypothetical protein
MPGLCGGHFLSVSGQKLAIDQIWLYAYTYSGQ